MGSVAPIPLRLSQTEQALGNGASLAEAQAILQREIAPIDDLRSTEAYRRQVAANLLGQFCAETARRWIVLGDTLSGVRR
jgi:xanthine dehydrogenase iron-sulfur cluster and FAD-binding subunit A